MQGFTIKVGNKTKTFYNKADYDNYIDYLNNGLKIIRKESRALHFNDGSRLIDITMAENPKKYILHKGNQTYTADKYIKKYLMV